MKDKSEVRHTGRAVFYTVLYPRFREAALELGYTLALHGSMATDMDLVAIPWIENASPEIELVKAFSDCIGETIWKKNHFKNPAERSHNRVTYTLSIYSDWYIDLSIMKRQQVNTAAQFTNSNMVEVEKVVGLIESQLHENNVGVNRSISNARLHDLITQIRNL